MFPRCIFSVIAILVAVSPAFGQTNRAEVDFHAVAKVLTSCPLAPSYDKPAKSGESALGAAGVALAAGIAGDVVGAGFAALAEALEEASKEKGFNVSAQANLYFYDYMVKQARAWGEHEAPVATVRPAMPNPEVAAAESVHCVVISYSSSMPQKNTANATSNPPPAVAFPSPEELDRLNLSDTKTHATYSAEWTNRNLPNSPDVYVEAELQARPDGFVVRPTLVWYRHALKGIPGKPLPAEIHMAFATPGAPANGTAGPSPFALARIQLPRVAPGESMNPAQLIEFVSPVMPMRPLDGSASNAAQTLATYYSQWLTEKRKLRGAEEDLQVMNDARKGATKDPKGSAKETQEQRRARRTLEESVVDSRRAMATLDGYRAGFITSNTCKDTVGEDGATIPGCLPHADFLSRELGTTNVQVRFTLVRDENKFLKAIATSLKTRGAAYGEALATQLSAPEWTPADSTYLTAMNAVAAAQRALDAALLSDDEDAVFIAEQTLREKKAAANIAAVALGRPIPFPGLI
ncbi:hypothetical protein ACQQ2N_17465 [Dokdonella sp. MW10]|uniref:hypothetical protein n=1 Tax=Dokdonella sp. MW10 TaxID=2992926 RepID=UPI003F8037DD